MAKAPVTIEENKKSIRPLSDKEPKISSLTERPLTTPKPFNIVPVFDNVEIIEKSTIQLNREIYSKKGFDQTVGVEFEELLKKEDTFSVTQFFKLFDSIFFDIPKIGKESHAAIINRSREYLRGFNLNDPKDTTINNLNDRIIELENELLLASQTDPEHPFFRNGSLLAEEVNGERTGKFYYMDKGFKRNVNYNPDFYRTLLKVLGYTSSDDYPSASRSILSNIPNGPNLDQSNLDQSTFIENGELFVGQNNNITTKDDTIDNLRSQVSQLNQTIENLREQLEESELVGRSNLNQNNEGNDSEGRLEDRDFGGQGKFKWSL